MFLRVKCLVTSTYMSTYVNCCDTKVGYIRTYSITKVVKKPKRFKVPYNRKGFSGCRDVDKSCKWCVGGWEGEIKRS